MRFAMTRSTMSMSPVIITMPIAVLLHIFRIANYCLIYSKRTHETSLKEAILADFPYCNLPEDGLSNQITIV